MTMMKKKKVTKGMKKDASKGKLNTDKTAYAPPAKANPMKKGKK
jgi:hypothetical protein